MIAIAQNKAKENKIENVRFECSTIDELNIAEQTLDVVLGLSILYLLDNKEIVSCYHVSFLLTGLSKPLFYLRVKKFCSDE